MLRTEVSTRKLVWGSDCDMTHMSRELTMWMQAFDQIGLTAQEQDDIFWGTAARIFGEVSTLTLADRGPDEG
jgi:predicted TIM-barrel fold metal-dependent hydrolase